MTTSTETMTPGPWGIHGDRIEAVIDDGSRTAVVEIALMRAQRDRAANARAIAQTPYMIQALEELLAEHDADDLPETTGTMWARHALQLARDGVP